MAENIESLLGSLHLSEERNRLLVTQVEQSSDAIFSHDQNGVVTSWNRGAARLYGYDPAEAIGRPLRELDLWQGRGPRGELGDRAEPASFETHARTRSGELVVVSVDPHDGRAVDFPSPVGYNRPRQNLEKPAISRRFGFARRIALFIKTSF